MQVLRDVANEFMRYVPEGGPRARALATSLWETVGGASREPSASLSDLPPELLARIQSELDPESRAALAATSRTMHDVTEPDRWLDQEWWRRVQMEHDLPHEYVWDDDVELIDEQTRGDEWTSRVWRFPGGDLLKEEHQEANFWMSRPGAFKQTWVYVSPDRVRYTVYRERRYDSPVQVEEWRKDDALHRERGPAFTERSAQGNVTREWHRDGALSRLDGGPTITVDFPGGKRRKQWIRDGRVVDDRTEWYGQKTYGE